MKKILRGITALCCGLFLTACGGGGDSSDGSNLGLAPTKLGGNVIGSGSPSGSFRLFTEDADGSGQAYYYVSSDGTGDAVAKGRFRYTAMGASVGELTIYDLRNTTSTSSATNFYINGNMQFVSATKCYWNFNYTVSGGDASEGGDGDIDYGVTINADGTVTAIKSSAGDNINHVIAGWGRNGSAAYTFTITPDATTPDTGDPTP